jgi:Uma2 family endonuclease
MPRAEEPIRKGMSFEEWLEFEQTSVQKHELVDGQLFAMAGSGDRHNRLAVRLCTFLESASEASECLTYAMDMKLRVPTGEGYYPDVMVLCDSQGEKSTYKTKPCLLVEVLSARTEALDRGEKLRNYQKLPTLQAYVLLSQDEPRAEVYRPSSEGLWLYEVIEGEGVLNLPCVPLQLALSKLFSRLD